MKATRKARDRARQSNAEKFEQLHRQVEAQAVIHDLIDEQDLLDEKFGKAIEVLRSMGVKAGEIEELTGINGIQQSRFLKAWQDSESDNDDADPDKGEDHDVEIADSDVASETEVEEKPEPASATSDNSDKEQEAPKYRTEKPKDNDYDFPNVAN